MYEIQEIVNSPGEVIFRSGTMFFKRDEDGVWHGRYWVNGKGYVWLKLTLNYAIDALEASFQRIVSE